MTDVEAIVIPEGAVTLEEFLRARYDEAEDEARAGFACGHDQDLGECPCDDPTEALTYLATLRAILDGTPWSLTGQQEHHGCPDCGDDNAIRLHEAILRVLAEQFSDHPDYRTVWGVTP